MDKYGLAEELLAAQNIGAVAAFAPSGLESVSQHEVLNKGIFSTVFEQANYILGDAITQTKIYAYSNQGVSPDTMRMFTLFGDPATRLKIAGD